MKLPLLILFISVLLLYGFGTQTLSYQAEERTFKGYSSPTRPLIDDYVVMPQKEEEYDIACFCVTFLREIKGVNIRGNASDIRPNIDHPLVGGVVLQKYGDVYHASYISAIFPNGNLWVEEANKKPCEITSRVIELDDKAIYGYFFKNPN